MPALLDEMKSSERAERQQNTRETWQLIFDIWSNAVPTAEAGRERMETLGLTYEQIEAGCALLDRRKKWVDELAAKQAILAQESPATEERNRLDAEFARVKSEYNAKRSPLNARIAAAEMAANFVPTLKDSLLRNLLPHVAENKTSLESRQREAGQRLESARQQLTTAETRERFLQVQLDKVSGRVEEHRWSSAEGKARVEGEKASAEKVLAQHQQGPLTAAREAYEQRQAERNAVDAKLSALLTGDALKLWV